MNNIEYRYINSRCKMTQQCLQHFSFQYFILLHFFRPPAGSGHDGSENIRPLVDPGHGSENVTVKPSPSKHQKAAKRKSLTRFV